MSQIIAPSTGATNVSTTLIYASQLGLALNCDLMTGLDKTTGAAAADDGPAINAAMAGATADNPICLIMDGSACVSGLKLPAGGHWSIRGFGWDTGFFVQAGANFHAIHNGTSSAANVNGAAPVRGANVTIKDIFINGNRGNGTNGNSTTGDPRGPETGGWYLGIALDSIDHILIEGVRFYNIAAFNLQLSNCGDWVVDKCHFENVLPTATVVEDNSDGVHVDGPSNDGRISNCYFRTGDDAIALNAPEGYGGLITRIAITNCIVNGAMSAGRMYTGSQAAGAGAQALIDGVSWTNCVGSTIGLGYSIGFIFGGTPVNDTITNVSFVNCRLTSPRSFAILSDTVGSLSFIGCEWTGSSDPNMFNSSGGAVQVTALNIIGCRAIRTPSANSVQALLGTASESGNPSWDAVWKRVNVNGFSVVDTEGYSGSAIAGLLSLTGGSTLASLQLDAVDASNITALAASGTASPTAVAGAGLLPSGWQVADSILVNSTLYLSSNDSGAPSIKIGGTAQRLTL